MATHRDDEIELVDAQLGQRNVRAVDVQASLLALTARSIADCLNSQPVRIEHVFVCGGGVHNRALMDALALALAPRSVQSVAAVGVDPDYVEAILFAWLARERIAERPCRRRRRRAHAGSGTSSSFILKRLFARLRQRLE